MPEHTGYGECPDVGDDLEFGGSEQKVGVIEDGMLGSDFPSSEVGLDDQD